MAAQAGLIDPNMMPQPQMAGAPPQQSAPSSGEGTAEERAAANVSRTDMIIASHESINGNYEKLKNIFKNNSSYLTEEERLKYINIYCTDKLKESIP